MGRRRYERRASLNPKVEEAVPYIDSVLVLRPHRMASQTYQELRDSLGPRTDGKEPIVVDRVDKPDWVGGYHLVYWIQQPTLDAMFILEEEAQEVGATIYGAHITLDLCVADVMAGQRLRQHIERRLVKNTRPSELVLVREGTSYIGRTKSTWIDPETDESDRSWSRRGTDIAVYERESKPRRGRPCVRLEYRAQGAEDVKRQLGTWADLRALDHREFWDDRLHLLKPPPLYHLVRRLAERIGREQGKSADGSRLSREERLVLADETLRELFVQFKIEYDTARASDILYALRQSSEMFRDSPSAFFSRESHDWMLPESGANALWE